MLEAIWLCFLIIWIGGFILMIIAFLLFELEGNCEYRWSLDYRLFHGLTNKDLLSLFLISVIPIFSLVSFFSILVEFISSTLSKSEEWLDKPVRGRSKDNSE